MARKGKGDRADAARQAPTRTMLEVVVTSARSSRMREAGVAADPAPVETHPIMISKTVLQATRVMQKGVPQLATKKEAVTTMDTITDENVLMTHEVRARTVVVVGTIVAAKA